MALARPWWLVWSAAMVGVLVGLAYQTSNAAAIAECLIDAQDTVALCAGPLPGWLLFGTLVAGLILTLLAVWRLARATD